MKLRNCPFCGGEAYLESDYELVRVECNGCGAITKSFERIDEAEAAWNRRVGDDLMERMEDDGK